jgi:hypothetical protein
MLSMISSHQIGKKCRVVNVIEAAVEQVFRLHKVAGLS